MPARSACVRKSGVVSIKTFWPFRESRMDVRIRLSRGSLEVQTAQWQPMVGTPMEVPEPSTVNCNGVPELPAEDEWGCKVFADMMRIGNAARYVVTIPATGLWPWWPLVRLAQPAPD